MQTLANSLSCKVLFINCWFCKLHHIIVIWEFLSNRWRFSLWQWSSFITDTIFKKKKSNLNLLNTCATLIHVSPTNMRWLDTTILSPISQHRGAHFFKSWARLVLFSKIYYFYNYIWGSQGKWHGGHFWQIKEKKEMMLNCCNLKCFKTKYQLVKSMALIFV